MWHNNDNIMIIKIKFKLFNTIWFKIYSYYLSDIIKINVKINEYIVIFSLT